MNRVGQRRKKTNIIEWKNKKIEQQCLEFLGKVFKAGKPKKQHDRSITFRYFI